MKVLFLAPVKKGGPHLSQKALCEHLSKEAKIEGEFKASLKGFIHAIFTRKYDVIHTTLPVPFNIWGTPIILNIKGDYRVERGLRNPLAYFYPLAIRTAKEIVVNGKFLKDKLKLKRKIKIIPNFTKKETLGFEKKTYNFYGNLKIGMISGFHFEEKARGIIDLLEILDKLDFDCNIEVLIGGSGYYLEAIKQEANNFNLKDIKVKFLDFVAENYKFTQNLDIYTFWSNLDNFPYVCLEAMTIGVPLITNDIGAVSEFIIDKKTGFICDKEEYGNILIKLIRSKNLREKYGKAGRQHIIKNYSIESVSEQFLQLYTKVVNQE